MKKILYFFTIILMVLFLNSCGNNGSSKDNGSSKSSGGNNNDKNITDSVNTANEVKKVPNTPDVILISSSYLLTVSINNSNDYKNLSYYVSYQKQGNDSWSEQIEKNVTPISISTSSIVGFHEGDEYKVRVRIKNEAGYSKYGYSDYVKVGESEKVESTEKIVPKPTGVTAAYYQNDNKVNVSWDYKDGIDKYYISYEKLSSDIWGLETSTTSIKKEFNVDNLVGKYRFRVRAYSDGVYSDYSYSYHVDIENSSIVSTPTNLSVRYSEVSDRFTISWDDQYIGIDAYISWKKSDEQFWSSEKEILNAISFESVPASDIQNFNKGDTYKFRVRIKKNGIYSDYLESDLTVIHNVQ